MLPLISINLVLHLLIDAHSVGAFLNAGPPASKACSFPFAARLHSAASVHTRPLSTLLASTASPVDEAAGLSTEGYPANPADVILSDDDLVGRVADDLFQNGFVIIDDAFEESEAKLLDRAMSILDDGVMLKGEDGNDGRDDSIRFVDERSAMVPIKQVMQRLIGLAEALQPSYVAALEDGSWETIVAEGHTAEPRPPATVERRLTAAPVAQLASYGPGGVYCVHSDNSRTAEDGPRRNERAMTAIVYCTPFDWTEEDEGWLRIWKDSDEVDCNVDGPAELGERLRKEGAPYEDILPLPGRVVVFRSALLHEVLPSKDRQRRAITQWFFAPTATDSN